MERLIFCLQIEQKVNPHRADRPRRDCISTGFGLGILLGRLVRRENQSRRLFITQYLYKCPDIGVIPRYTSYRHRTLYLCQPTASHHCLRGLRQTLVFCHSFSSLTFCMFRTSLTKYQTMVSRDRI